MERSQIMAKVKSKDTKPELAVRKFIYGLGYRYRLYDASLPGKPDLVFRKRKKVIFVHGCFWHGHDCRAGNNRPSSNTEYWNAKLSRNMNRDAMVQKSLVELGWKYFIIWECETKNIQLLKQNIRNFLDK